MTPLHLFVAAASVLSVLSEERLSTDVVPVEYEVKLQMRPSKWNIDNEVYDGSFNGTVCILFEYKQGAGKIKLHGKKKYGMRYGRQSEMTLIHLVEEKFEEEMSFKIDDVEYDDENDLFVLPPTNLKLGLYKLCIPFWRYINVKSGYYMVLQGDKRFARAHLFDPLNWSEPYLKFFMATNTPKQISFPCFDEPYLRADFKFDLKIEYYFKSKEVKTFSNDDSNKRRETYKIWGQKFVEDSYMIRGVDPSRVSFAVTNIDCHHGFSVIGIEVAMKYQYCSFEDSWLDRTNYQVRLLHTPKHRFYTKLMRHTRLLIVPGIEQTHSFKPGLILISDKEVEDPDNDLLLYIRLNSQIYGGIIRPGTKDSAWILSALTHFCAYRQLEKGRLKDKIISTMTELPNKSTSLLFKESTDVFQGMFDADMKKGLMLLNMVLSIVGEDRFGGLLYNFIHSKRFKDVNPIDLWDQLDISYRSVLPPVPPGITWTRIMSSWVDNHHGYPLVSVDLSQEGKLTVTQERFYGNIVEKLKHDEVKGYTEECWHIPLSYTIIEGVKKHHVRTNKAPKQIAEDTWLWLPCDSAKPITVATKSSEYDLVLVNADYKSFLRVKYDPETKNKIINTLRDRIELFSASQRAQLIHDAFSTAWSGYQDYDFPFQLMNVAVSVQKTEFMVWNAMLSGMHHLNEMLSWDSETHERFQVYLTNAMIKMYNANYNEVSPFKRIIGVDPREKFPEDEEDDLFIKWACTVAQIGGCVDAAIEVFDKWEADRKKTVAQTFSNYFDEVTRSSTLVYTVICTAVSTSTMEDEQAEERYWVLENAIRIAAAMTYRDWVEEYVEALKCIRDPRVAKETFEWIAEREVQFQTKYERHKAKTFLMLAENPFTYKETLQLFYDKIDVLAFRHRDKKEQLARFVRTLTSKMNRIEIKQMKQFIKSKPELDVEVVNAALEEGSIAARARRLWYKNNLSNIQNLLPKV